MHALAAGLQKHNVYPAIRSATDLSDGADFTVWWGNRAPAAVRNKPVLVLEAGAINGRSGDYVRDRLRFITAGWNGLWGRVDPRAPERPPDRWEKVGIEITPWRDQGDYVLVCDQHPGDLTAPPERGWWSGAEQLAENLGIRCLYRPHPLMAPGLRPLSEALEGAARCVTWSSTAAVEAILAGVPCITLDYGSPAWDVSQHDFQKTPCVCDRDQWAYNLGYLNWTHDELRDGSAWEHVQYGTATGNSAG